MKSLNFTIPALVLAIASAAAAQNLVSYRTDVDGTIYYYESDSVHKVDAGYINVWTLLDGRKDPSLKWTTSRILVKVDCDDMTYKRQYGATYDANRRIIEDFNSEPEPFPATPGSHEYSLVEAICARYK
jgi:hypothetical protein